MNTASSQNLSVDEQAFLTERNHVCDDFAQHELQHQRGQLSRSEYLIVSLLLVVTYVLVLVLQ